MKPSAVRQTRSGRSSRLASAFLALLIVGAACAPLGRPRVPVPEGVPIVRVGILVDTTAIELGATTDYTITDGSGRVLHRMSAGESVTAFATDAGDLALRMGAGEEAAPRQLRVVPAVPGMVRIGGRPYRGIASAHAAGPGRVTAVNEVDMESYLLGVVPYEIGRVGPELLEASKAQAVAARTYAIRYLGRRAALGFDVFATVEDQVYGGAEGEHDPISEAVRATEGEVLTYVGEPIEAFYHSTCAGRTAAIEEVWPEEPRPYLQSVVDIDPATGEAFDSVSNRFRWTQRWTAEELEGIFQRTLADSLPTGSSSIGRILEMQVLERTASGRIARMRIVTSGGTFHVGGDRIRWIFLTQAGNILNSSRFDVVLERDQRGEVQAIVAEGMGWGHGIGMCQVGAMGRARAGQDYRTILQTYYAGTEITRIY